MARMFTSVPKSYAPTNLNNSKANTAGQTSALRTPKAPIQKSVADEMK